MIISSVEVLHFRTKVIMSQFLFANNITEEPKKTEISPTKSFNNGEIFSEGMDLAKFVQFPILTYANTCSIM